jgi:hypothetical protein
MVTAGQRQERPFFVVLMEAGAAHRAGRSGSGCGDARIRAAIPQPASERMRRRFDKGV